MPLNKKMIMTAKRRNCTFPPASYMVQAERIKAVKLFVITAGM
jgi:hypothetical protein